jgi:hypothetical protein
VGHYDDCYEEKYAEERKELLKQQKKERQKKLVAAKKKWPRQYNIIWDGITPVIKDCWYGKKLSLLEILNMLNSGNTKE